MTLIGRASMRRTALVTLLLTSAVLAVLARAEDVATLEYDLEPLPVTGDRPQATDAPVGDAHRRARTSSHAELSSKAKREQALRNLLARRRQILNQRSHESSRVVSSRTPRPGNTTSKDPPDILETQETRHSVHVTSEEKIVSPLRKAIEKIVPAELEIEPPSKTSKVEISMIERHEGASSTLPPTVTTGQKSGDAETRKKNTVSMPESLYNHFRPVESNIPVEDMSQFLYFGQKLQPDAHNITGGNNSVEATSTVPTSSRRRYSTKRLSATIAAPAEEIVNDEMNIALDRRTVEKNQVSRIKNTFRSPGSGLYYRKTRPTADVASNVIPGNESSLVGETNTVDDKFRRGDSSAHAGTQDQAPRERGSAAHVADASTTTQIPRDDEAGVAESETPGEKLSNETVAATNGITESFRRMISDFVDGEKSEAEKVREAKSAEKSAPRTPSAEKTRTRSREPSNVKTSPGTAESSTLRIVVPDDSPPGFAAENERAQQNTVTQQQPVADSGAERPARVPAGDAPKSLALLSTPTKPPVAAVDSNWQRPQQPQQQHVYAYTITNVTRLLRNYTGPGLSEKERGGGSAGRRAGSSGAEITSAGPSQQRRPQQQTPPPPPPPPPQQQSSPLLLPRASIEPARAPAGLSVGATVEPAAAVEISLGVVDSLVGERSRKVVPQQQRASGQRAAAAVTNDSVISPSRAVKSPEPGSRGPVRWSQAKSRSGAEPEEGANDRRFLRKSASAVLNQRSNVNEESSSSPVVNKRRRVLAPQSGVPFSPSGRRVKSGESRERERGKERVLVASDRSSNGTVGDRGGINSDDETSSDGSLWEVARASGVNEMPGDSSPSESISMGNLSRNSSAIGETTGNPSVDATVTDKSSDVVLAAEDTVTASGASDEDNQDVAVPGKTESDANVTDSVVAATTVTERLEETVATTTSSAPAAPVFPVTPKILTEAERTPAETLTLRPTDAAKAPEPSNLDPSEIQKRYRAKDATTTTTTTTTESPLRDDTRPANDTLLDVTSAVSISAPVTENGKRASGERSPEVKARNLSDKSKDKDDVLPIMHLYNTSDIFNGSDQADGFARGTERPRVTLPVETENPAKEEQNSVTTTATTTTTTTTTTTITTTTEKTSEPTATVSSTTGSTSTIVPVFKSKELAVTPNSQRDRHEENRDSQDTTAAPTSRGSSFAANRTRYRPAYHHSILPDNNQYNGTIYDPVGINRTFLESMNISDVISRRHDGDAIATQETVAVVTYILATLVVFPIAVGVGLILRRLILRNRKVLEESDTSSEISCRKDALNLENGDFKTSIEKAITKLPRIQHLCHEAEKPPPPPSQESRWEFPRDKLRLQTVLGQGNFGQVWKAEADDLTGHQGTTRLVAVKTVKEGASDREKEDLDRELEIMKQLGSHPNVVTLLGCCTEEEPHYLILEYVMYGKLLAYLRDHRTRQYFYNFSEDSAALTSRDLTVFGYCVARGMEYLASNKIIHRDLAARNVLVDHNKLCKIADFGMSRFANEDGEVIETRHGRNALPIRWMAPESLIYSLFTTKTDVWSFGILMWEIVTLGSTPYPDMTAREVMRNVHNGYRLERPSHCRSELFRVISRCWHADPDRRPEFQTLRRDLAQLLEDNMNGHYVDLESFASECTD